MNERERWIVYPLLFLALGAALRDKLVDRTTTKRLVCQELIVVDEQPLGQEPVLLAQIGRADAATGEAGGQLLLNGQLEIVDRDPIANQTVRRLITMGRAQPAPNAAAGGYVVINGQVTVDAINAGHYAYRGVQLMPALRAVLPGVSLSDLLRAIPQVVAPQQGESKSTPAPPENSPTPQSPPSAPSDSEAKQP